MVEKTVLSKKILKNVALLKNNINKNLLKIGIISTGINNISGMNNVIIENNINKSENNNFTEIKKVNEINKINQYFVENKYRTLKNKDSFFKTINDIFFYRCAILKEFKKKDLNIEEINLKKINNNFGIIQDKMNELFKENIYNFYSNFYNKEDVKNINDNIDKSIIKSIPTNNLKTTVFNDMSLCFTGQKYTINSLNRHYIIRKIIGKHTKLIQDLIKDIKDDNIKNKRINIIVNNINNILSIFLDKNTEMAIDYFLKETNNQFIREYIIFKDKEKNNLIFKKLEYIINYPSTIKTYKKYINKILSINNSYRAYANTYILRYFLEKISTNSYKSKYYYDIIKNTFIINSPVEFTNFIIKNDNFNFIDNVKKFFFNKNNLYLNNQLFISAKIYSLKLLNATLKNVNKSLEIQINLDKTNIIIEDDFVNYIGYSKVFNNYKIFCEILNFISNNLILFDESILFLTNNNINTFLNLYESANLFNKFIKFKIFLRKINNIENNKEYKYLLNDFRCVELLKIFKDISITFESKLKDRFFKKKITIYNYKIIKKYLNLINEMNKDYKIKKIKYKIRKKNVKNIYNKI